MVSILCKLTCICSPKNFVGSYSGCFVRQYVCQFPSLSVCSSYPRYNSQGCMFKLHDESPLEAIKNVCLSVQSNTDNLKQRHTYTSMWSAVDTNQTRTSNQMELCPHALLYIKPRFVLSGVLFKEYINKNNAIKLFCTSLFAV